MRAIKKTKRIRRYDKLNWVIETYKTPELISKGKYKGQMSKAAWVIEGYYGALHHIPEALIREYIGGTHSDVKSILNAIEEARLESVKIIEDFCKNGENKND